MQILRTVKIHTLRTGAARLATAAAVGLLSMVAVAPPAVAEQLRPAAGPPTGIIPVDSGGTAQTGHSFPDRLAVEVVDSQQQPVPGVAVTFTIQPLGSGSTGTATFSGPAPTTVTDVTDVNGLAVTTGTTITAGAAGDVAVQAGALGLPTQTLTLIVTPIVPVVMFISGDAQTAGTGLPFAQPVVVLVADGYGTPLTNWPITFEVQIGGYYTASATFPGGGPSATVTTDSQGLATSPPITAGPSAGQVLLVVASGLDDENSAVLDVVDAPPATATIGTGLRAVPTVPRCARAHCST